MKYLLRIYPLLLMAMVYIVLTSQYNNPENGKTGAPGEGNCADCHTPSSAIDGNISLTGIPDVLYTGNTYTVTLRVNSTLGNPVDAGMQLVVLDENNNSVGNLFLGQGKSGTVTDINNGRTYLKHVGGPTNFYDSTFTQWTFDWTAPDSISAEKTISFYVGAVLSNGDSSVLGDRPIKTEVNSLLQQGSTGLTISASQQDIRCFGEANGSISLTILGGALPYSINWSTGDSTTSISQLSSDSYSVTVIDANTDTISENFMITEPTELQLELVSKSDLGCSGQTNGFAEVRASGGTGKIDIRWPNGDTSRIRNNLTARSYPVIATDENGCSDTLIVTIDATINIQPNSAKIDESFPGANDGVAYITPTGGTPPYLVLWSKDNATSDTIANLAPGKYVVLLSDLTGCLIADTIEILKGTCKLSGAINVIHNHCFADKNGSIDLNITNAQGNINYLWSTGDTTSSIQNLAAGIYTIFATDTVGCIYSDTIQIVQPAELQLIPFSTSNSTCNSAMDGFIIVQVEGGTSPYSLNWNSGATMDTLPNLPSGTYSVTVTDSTGCQDSLTVELTEEDRLPPQLLRTSFNLQLDASGNAVFPNDSLSGLIIDNCGLDSIFLETTSFTCNEIGENSVILTAMDESGNILRDTLTIVVIDDQGPVFIPKENVFSRSCSGFIYNLPVATDNCELDTLRLIEGIGPGGIFPLGNTTEKYLAIDKIGNSSTYSFLINIDPDVDFSPTYTIPSCPGFGDGSIQLSPSVDTIVFSYIWGNGATGQSLDSIESGTYSILITDTLGCQYIDTFELIDPFFSVIIDSMLQPSNESNGFISIQISGGVAPYNISWSKDGNLFLEDLFEASGLSTGNYLVQVEDANGCIISSDSISLEKTSSVNDPWLAEIKIYPNPVQGVIRINMPNEMLFHQLTVYTLTGTTVYQTRANYHHIDLPRIPAGIYIAKVETDHGQIIRKLVVN